MRFLRRPFAPLIPVMALTFLLGGSSFAQLDGTDRGIDPYDSSTNFEIGGVQVDVRAASGEAARTEGWRRAQLLGWRMLWARTHNRPVSEAPDLPESTLSSIISGIIIEQEQIGPNRYIARLGVMFDRARTGQLLGVSGQIARSAPMLLIPVMTTGSASYSFEFRTLWQRAWAEFRTGGSTIDYVRTAGRGIDPLLLNYAQTQRRGRGWWRMLLDQYGASDILVAELDLRRLYPGGPALGIFTARYGPDSQVLGRFVLRAANSGAVRTMLDEGVRRLDGLYRQALAAGLLGPIQASSSSPRRSPPLSKPRSRSRSSRMASPLRQSPRSRLPRRFKTSTSRSRPRMRVRCSAPNLASAGSAASPRRSPPALRLAAIR